MEEKMKITGHINFKLYDSEGNLKDERNVKNLIVTAGKNYLANWLVQATQSDYFMRYLAIGTGTNAAQATDTALQTEVGTRVAGALVANNNVFSNSGTFGAGNGTGAISEAGILSASTSGTMLARRTFTSIYKDVGDSLQVTWQITLS